MDAHRIGVWFGARTRPVQVLVLIGAVIAAVATVILVFKAPPALGALILVAGLLKNRSRRTAPRTRGVLGPLIDLDDERRLAEVERRRTLAGPDGFVPLTELADPPVSSLRASGSGPVGFEALAGDFVNLRDAIARGRKAARAAAPAPPAERAPPAAPPPRPAASKAIVEDGPRWRRRPRRRGSIVE